MNTFTEADHPRGQAANKGQFREKTNSSPTTMLVDEGRADWVRDRDEYLRLRDEPGAIDFEETFDTIAAEISNDSFGSGGTHSWEAVIGQGLPRTKANVARYREYLARVAAEEPRFRERHASFAKTHAQLDSYAKAYELGIAIHPAAEAYFEGEWAGDGPFSETCVRLSQQELKSLRAGLEGGFFRPSVLIGSGYRNPKKMAFEYLDRRDREVAREIQTRGRSNSALASNALAREKRAIAEDTSLG